MPWAEVSRIGHNFALRVLRTLHTHHASHAMASTLPRHLPTPEAKAAPSCAHLERRSQHCKLCCCLYDVGVRLCLAVYKLQGCLMARNVRLIRARWTLARFGTWCCHSACRVPAQAYKTRLQTHAERATGTEHGTLWHSRPHASLVKRTTDACTPHHPAPRGTRSRRQSACA